MPSYPTDPAAELRGRLSTIPTGTPTATVASELLDYFTGGGIAPGERLPPERRLAEMLGTGRSAVREALAALEILGIVDVRPGSGTYLRSSASELLPRTLSWGLMLGSGNAGDLVQIRTELEVLAARLAAPRIDAEGLRRVREALAGMRDHADLGDHDAFVQADARFHQAVAAASGNTALAGVLQSVRALLRVWVDRSVGHADDARTAIREHTRLVDALAAGDGDDAAEAMGAHMATASQRVLTVSAESAGAAGAPGAAS